MEITGTIKAITDIQTFASGFQKREIVVVTNEQYPQPINIEFLQDKVDLPEVYKIGDEVKVSINIRGKEWTSPQGEVKYFNQIVGWRMEKIAAAEPVKETNTFDDDDDDLGF